MIRRVAIESPFAPTDVYSIEQHRRYLEEAMADCFRRGEAPFASHGFYTYVLDDCNPTERALGIAAGFRWAELADLVAVYVDLGCSRGMQDAIRFFEAMGKPIERRMLDPRVCRAIREMD